MKNIHIILVLIAIALMSSCEDVIVLELDNTEPRIVIEAIMNMSDELVKVDLTKTNDFYDNGAPEKITNASINIIDESGTEIAVPSDGAGAYLLNNFKPITGETYRLEVDAENVLYQATAIAPVEVPLMAIDTILSSPPFGGGDPFYQSFFRWQDTENANDFYRVKAIVNDTIAGLLSLYDDNGLDGQLFIRPLMAAIDVGDNVDFQLISIDRETYEYFLQVDAAQGGGGSVPFNPQGNFDNNALGYFGIQSTNTINIQF